MADTGPVGAAPDSGILRAQTVATPAATESTTRPAKDRVRKQLPPWGPGGRELVTIMVLSHAVQHFYATLLPLTYPYAIEEFGVSITELGIVLGIVGVIGGLLQGAAGLFGRVSARTLLTAQNIGLAIASVLGGLAPGFGLYGAARFFGAVVSWPQHPIGSAVLAHRFPERRGAALTWHTTGGSIGTVSVPIIAGFIIANWGWRPALFVFAVPLLLGGLMVALRLRDEHGTKAGVAPAAAPPAIPLSRVLRRRGAIIVLLVATIAAGGRGLGVLNAYIPSYLGLSEDGGLGFGPVMVGVLFGVLVFASVIGPVIEGHTADRVGHLPVLWVTYLLGAAGILAYPLVGANVLGLLAAGALIGLFAYADSALLQGLFSEAVHGASQRAAFGLFFAIAYGVGSIWAPAIGWIIDNWGFASAFYVMAASFVLAAGVSLFARGTEAEGVHR